MNYLTQKFRQLWLPFLGGSAAFILCYSLLAWFFMVISGMHSDQYLVLQLFVPAVLSWVLVSRIVKPRLKRVRFGWFMEDKKRSLCVFVAFVATALPTFFIAMFIVANSKIVLPLYGVMDLGNQKSNVFYSTQRCFLDTSNVGIYVTVEAGEDPDEERLSVYAACPINDGTHGHQEANVWYVEVYSREYVQDMPDRDRIYHGFISESYNKFKRTDIARIPYIVKLSNENPYDPIQAYQKAIANANSRTLKKQPVFLRRADSYLADPTPSKVAWALVSFLICGILFVAITSGPRLEEPETGQISASEAEPNPTTAGFPMPTIQVSKIVGTSVIVGMNVLVFIIMVSNGLGFFDFRTVDLLKWGADYAPLTTHGQWWRLLTSIFIHGGVVHLTMNMAALLYVGGFLEPRIGTQKYVVGYVLTGLIASICSVWWHSDVVSIGASGAIFGLYGIFLALLITRRFPPALNQSLLGFLVVFIAYNILFSLNPHIDIAAHIGGLVSGVILGLIIATTISKPDETLTASNIPKKDARH